MMVRISAPVNGSYGAEICVIGARLKEERLRLGLTQPEFGDVAGAKKRTLIDWESDVSSPTAVQLARLSAAGVDVLYVLLGARDARVGPALSEQEMKLLKRFRALGEIQRAQAIGMLELLAVGASVGGGVSIRNTSATGSGSGTVIGGDVSGTVIGGSVKEAPKRRR